MPRTCRACASSEREAIDAALVAGVPPLRNIAKRVSISPAALHRHKKHLSQAIRSTCPQQEHDAPIPASTILSRSKVKAKRSIKPYAIKAQVLARTAVGQDKTRISKDLGIHRHTVTRILNDAEFRQALEATKYQTAELLDKSVEHIRFELDSRRPGAGFRLQEGFGILGPKQETQIQVRDITFNVVYTDQSNPKKTIDPTTTFGQSPPED